MNTQLMFGGAITLALVVSSASGGPGDSFTYQGILKQGGAVLNDSPNITVRLFDVLVGGAELDSVLFIAQPVVDGLFVVDLPFEAALFDGGARYLQFEMNGLPLSPRQPVLPTPYAMHAQSVGDSALPPIYLGTVEFSNASNTFAGDGSGLTNLNPANLSGPITTGQLPSGGGWALTSDLNVDNNTFFIDATNDWVGVGTSVPQTAFHISNTNPRLTLQDSNSPSASQEGFISFKDNTDTETAWIGLVSDTNLYIRNNIGDIVLNPPGNDVVLEGQARLMGGDLGVSLADGGRLVNGPTNSLNLAIGDAEIQARNNGSAAPLYLNADGGVVVVGIGSGTSTLGVGTQFTDADLHIIQSSNALASANGLMLQENGGPETWRIYHSGSDLCFVDNGNRVARIQDDTGLYIQDSDRSVKKNIVPMQSVLSQVIDLDAVRYHYSRQDDTDPQVYGFIAQQVGAQFPDLVHDSNGELGLSYSDFGVLAIKAIQEQQVLIERLETRIEELERRTE